MKNIQTIGGIRVEVIKIASLDINVGECSLCVFDDDERCDSIDCCSGDYGNVYFTCADDEIVQEETVEKNIQTIGGIRVEVIKSNDSETGQPCSHCVFNDDDRCDSIDCLNGEYGNVYFKRVDDEIVPEGTVEKYDDSFVKYLMDGQDYYKSVCHSVGNLLGIAAYTSDDGVIQDSVLVAKLEELVAELVLENVKLKSKINALEVLGSKHD